MTLLYMFMSDALIVYVYVGWLGWICLCRMTLIGYVYVGWLWLDMLRSDNLIAHVYIGCLDCICLCRVLSLYMFMWDVWIGHVYAGW